HRLAAGEGLAAPPTPFVTVVVVEPPDELAGRVEQPGDGAVRSLGELANRPRRLVPRVKLDDAARVGAEEQAVGPVARPLGQRRTGRPEPPPPRRLVGAHVPPAP